MADQGSVFFQFGVTPPTSGVSTPFTDPMLLVEREEHLLRMQTILDDVRSGHGQLIVIESEIGLGKTYIAQLLMQYALANSWEVAHSHVQTNHANAPYMTWRTLMYFLFNIEPLSLSHVKAKQQRQQNLKKIQTLIQQANPLWLERLPLLSTMLNIPISDTPTTAALDPLLRQEALTTFILDLLRWKTSQNPLLIVIDDSDQLDEASEQLTLSTARALSDTPIVLMLIRQSSNTPSTFNSLLQELPYCTNIQLNPCAEAGTQLIIEEQLHAPAAPELVSYIHHHTQGNPLFCVELLSYLRETRHVHMFDGTWNFAQESHDLPTTVEQVIIKRLAHVPSAAHTLAEYASVIGSCAEAMLLQQILPSLSDTSILHQHLRVLVDYDILLPFEPHQTLFYFRHETIRQAIYAKIPHEQRRAMHLAVAEALTHLRSEDVETMAEHFVQAEQPQRALSYLERAADRAMRESANHTALRCYQQLLILEKRWAWQKKVIDLLHLLGQREEERIALEASEQINDREAADVALAWGQYYEHISDYEQATIYLQQAYEMYHKKRYRPGEITTILRLGQTSRYRGDYAAAQRWYSQGLQSLAQRAARSPESQEAQIRLLIGLGTVYRQQGDFLGARARYMQALGLATKTNNPVSKAIVLNSLGSIAYYQRSFIEAQKFYEQALTLHRTIGNRPQEGTLLYNLAMTFQELSEYDRAREYVLAALTIQQSHGNRWEEANIWNMLGTLEHQLGNIEDALRCLQRGQNLAQRIGAQGIEAYIKANVADVWVDLGKFDVAAQTLNEAFALAETQKDRLLLAHLLSHLGMVALHQCQPDQAIQYAQQALERRRGLKLELWTTADLTTLAMAHSQLGNHIQATKFAHEAVALLNLHRNAGLESPQRDYFICSQVFATAGDQAMAQTLLTEAATIIKQQLQHITKPHQQQSFLENLPTHRAIMQTHASKPASKRRKPRAKTTKKPHAEI